MDVGKRWKSVRNAVRVPTARYLRRLWPGVTVACVTGTSGKSTATELLGALLSNVGETKVWSFRNTPEAVARNIFHTSPFGLKFLVHEIGADKPGNISQMAGSLKPDVGLVTLIGLEHRKTLRTKDDVAAEKSELLAILPRSGLAVLNGDDPYALAMADRTKARVVTFGKGEHCDLRLLDASYDWKTGLRMMLAYRGTQREFICPLVGVHWTASIMAALLAGLELGVDMETCVDVVGRYTPRFQRLSVHRRRGGGRFILDTVKAPLWSMELALSVMADIDAPRKTIIIGTISDTSGTRRKNYAKAARAALAVADRVIFTGPQSSGIRTEKDRQPDAPLYRVERYDALRTLLAEDVVEGEVILIKASGVDHLERLMYEEHGPVVCRLERCNLPGTCADCLDLVGEEKYEFRRQQATWMAEAERHVPLGEF